MTSRIRELLNEAKEARLDGDHHSWAWCMDQIMRLHYMMAGGRTRLIVEDWP
jgi:hypothetical protein